LNNVSCLIKLTETLHSDGTRYEAFDVTDNDCPTQKTSSSEILNGGGKFVMRLIFGNFYVAKKQNSVTD
jgi:hypothetical protein